METIFAQNNLLTFGVVLLAIVATWNTLWTGVRNYREAKKPRDDEKARLDAVEEHLDNDNRRLNELEGSNRLLLRAFSVMLEHEISGDHVEQLERVRDDINTYLINR